MSSIQAIVMNKKQLNFNYKKIKKIKKNFLQKIGIGYQRFEDLSTYKGEYYL